ncbi:MAG: hypothetical protein JST64_13160 [Actinobacteria bacterium]|nr:hypothetical protein [Actinomycetota bacterium]
MPAAARQFDIVVCLYGAMFVGVGLFAIAAVLVIVAFVAMRGQRKGYEATGNPNDELSDEQFRRIEFGDDEP